MIKNLNFDIVYLIFIVGLLIPFFIGIRRDKRGLLHELHDKINEHNERIKAQGTTQNKESPRIIKEVGSEKRNAKTKING